MNEIVKFEIDRLGVRPLSDLTKKRYQINCIYVK